MKAKMPKMEDYLRIKEKMSKDETIPKDELEDSAAVVALLDANGPIKEPELIEALNSFSVEIGLWEAIHLGHLKIVGSKNGEPQYSLTDAGRHYVENDLLIKP